MKKSLITILLASVVFTSVPLAVYANASYETLVVASVNMRTSPNGAVIGLIKKNEQIHIIEKTNAYWLYVEKQDGMRGYISSSSKYTSYNPPAVDVAPVPEQPAVTDPIQNTGAAQGILSSANALIGRVTYRYGVNNSSSFIFDCSAFTRYVFAQHGINIPWGSRSQAKLGSGVSREALQPGDLMFFTTTSNRTVNHVGIYMGNGNFIHNTPSAKGVTINTINSGYWQNRLLFSRRVL